MLKDLKKVLNSNQRFSACFVAKPLRFTGYRGVREKPSVGPPAGGVRRLLEYNIAFSNTDGDKHKPADLIMFRYKSVEMYGISRLAIKALGGVSPVIR